MRVHRRATGGRGDGDLPEKLEPDDDDVIDRSSTREGGVAVTRKPEQAHPGRLLAGPVARRVRCGRRSPWSTSSARRNLDAIGVIVTSDGDLPEGIGLDREALARAGFEAKAGHDARAAAARRTLIIVSSAAGPAAELDRRRPPRRGAAFMRATSRFARIGLRVPSIGDVDAEAAGRALAEGASSPATASTRCKPKPKDPARAAWSCCVDGADRDRGIRRHRDRRRHRARREHRARPREHAARATSPPPTWPTSR